MPRVVLVADEAARLEGVGDPLDALAGEARAPGRSRRPERGCPRPPPAPASGRSSGRPGGPARRPPSARSPLSRNTRMTRPLKASPAGVRGAPLPASSVIDSMLSIRYRTHDSIMSYRRASRMDCRLELIAVPGLGRRPGDRVLPRPGRLQPRLRPQGQRGAPLRPADPARVGLLDRDRRRGHARRARQRGRACRSSSTTRPRPARISSRTASTPARSRTFPWGRFTFFADPDGNRWAVQEIIRPS